MESIENFVNAAREKGFDFEAYSHCIDSYGDFSTFLSKSYFGFTPDNKKWYWFYASNIIQDKLEKVHWFFDKVYYTGTGASYKTYKKEYNALCHLGINTY